MADQLPGLPEASFARARHHMVFIGSVPLLNCDAVTVWFTMNGVRVVDLDGVAGSAGHIGPIECDVSAGRETRIGRRANE